MPSAAETSLRLWVVLNRAVQSIEEHLRRQVEAQGLGFSEFAVLEALLHKGTLPIGELGDRVLLTSGSMTYVVDKLERRGLVTRRACPSDRRVVHAELSETGRMLITRVFAEHADLLNEVMGGLSDEERSTAADLIKRLGLYARHFASSSVPV